MCDTKYNHVVIPAIWWLFIKLHLVSLKLSSVSVQDGFCCVCWSDLQVAGLVVQGGPGAEAGLGPRAADPPRLVVRPAELPPLHRVRSPLHALTREEENKNNTARKLNDFCLNLQIPVHLFRFGKSK